MKRKKFVSVIAIILAVLMLMSLVASVIPVVASADDTEDELTELMGERDELVQQMLEQEELIADLEAQHADIVQRKQALDERNQTLQQEIDILNREIEICKANVAEKEEELAAAQEKEAEQLAKYRVRVRAMEESGGYDILTIIFNTENFASLLSAIDDIEEIIRSDEELEQSYIEAREAVELTYNDYVSAQAELEERQNLVEEESAQLEAQMAEADAMIEQVLNSIDEENEELAQITADERASETAIANIIAEREAARAAEEAARQQQAQQTQQQSSETGSGSTDSSESGSSSDTGSTEDTGNSESSTVVGSGNFCWPTSCTYITSCVGYRYHPISGEWKYHSGMDIGASYGASVWASDSGEVIIAGENGGYGNCVMIDHKNGYYTLYGHLSSIAVSVGQNVYSGNVIGYVGSTGVSTGPHLHFEIRYGDTCLEFNDWFGGLTFAPDSGG